MSNWGKPVLTKQGLKLQAKVDAGSRMQLTQCKIGSGTLSSGQNLEDLTALIAPVQTLPIASISYSENNSACVIAAVTDNSNVTSGYYLREFGVYARDPDDGEILYAVAQDSNPDYIPPKGTSAVISQEIGVALSFSNATNVTAYVNTSAIATITYVNSYVASAVADLKDMTGASPAQGGVHGLVPAPAAGNSTRYLRSDGSWAAIVAMSGASTTVNGAAGLVPAPVAGSSIRYLCADGTWKEVDLDSAKTKLVKYS